VCNFAWYIKKEHRLRVYENRVLILFTNVIRVITSRRMKCEEHVGCTGKMKYPYTVLVVKSEELKRIGRHRHRNKYMRL
jgi:hypothetical protein